MSYVRFILNSKIPVVTRNAKNNIYFVYVFEEKIVPEVEKYFKDKSTTEVFSEI